MKNSKKILSLALTLALVLSAIFCTGAVANAEITTSTTSQVTVLTPPDSIDVSSLGTNIVTDPTVAEWDGDTYKTYYSTIGSSVSASVVGNANAWWDQPACFNQRYVWGSNKTFGTLKENNRLTKEVTHTADGSGAIVLTSKSSYFPIQTNATPKYFLYTFWAKAAEDNTLMQFTAIISDGNTVGTQVNTRIHSDWTLVTLLLTAGTKQIHGMNVYVGSASATAPVYIDDVYMFQLDDTYGETLKENGKFLSPDDITYASSDTASAKLVTIADDFDLSTLGTNLAYDANVSKFTDGVYDTATGIRGVGGVTNTNQDMWGSPTVYNGYSSAAADSHTQDGSGALKYTLSGANHRLFRVAPNSESHSYYLVTFYYKGPNLQLRHYFSYNQIPDGDRQITTVTGASDWKRVSYIVYSGSYATYMNMGGYIQSGTAYFDDFAVYKLTSGVGGRSFDAGVLLGGPQFPGTKITAEENSTVTLDVVKGYFVPHGAFATADGTIAEKQVDGTFKVSTAGTYNYTQFKYPTGTVGTFGASAKTDADDTKTGIQFGSLITDNLSVDKDAAQGTLVFRDTDKGTFEEFRATFPTKTRKELVAEIYAKLKAAEEANSINLANRAVTLNNGGKSVVVMYVPRTTYMWKNSENTELQYAVRVHSIATNYGDVNYTAIGYVTKDGKLEFSNEIKDGVYNELIPAAN